MAEKKQELGCVESTEPHATSKEKVEPGHSMVTFLALPLGGIPICSGVNSPNHGIMVPLVNCTTGLHSSLHKSHFPSMLAKEDSDTRNCLSSSGRALFLRI